MSDLSARPPWWACEEPERPADPDTVWHIGCCQGCAIKIRVEMAAIDTRLPGFAGHLRFVAASHKAVEP